MKPNSSAKLFHTLLATALLYTTTALAQSPITITIDPRASTNTIPPDFVGLSFGMKALLPSGTGGHFFSPTNTPLVTLFQNLGLRHLRVGGTTVESPPATPIPDQTDIDNLFTFARAAGVRQIIYSFRLLETNSALHYEATNAALARYIWTHYRTNLEYFALGNEPDLQRVFHQDFFITNFSTYLQEWQKFAAAITNAVPDAKFAGPDAGSGNISWTTRFAKAEKSSGLVNLITEHFYAGGAGKGVDASQGIETMLSADWLKTNQMLYDKMAVPVMSEGLPYRFTEANDHYTGGVKDASDTFTGALWALDFLHWWAAHQARGVDFHNTMWVVSDVISPDENGQLRINPKGYGLKAFDLGAHGYSASVSISNPEGINLTAYAYRDNTNLFVTIINKNHGTAGRAADVTIVSSGIPKHSEAIFLTAPNGDVTAKTGVTLGGATINNNSAWQGKWTSLASDKAGQCSVKVPPAAAVVVKMASE